MTDPQLIKILIGLTVGTLIILAWICLRSKRRHLLLLYGALAFAACVSELGLRVFKPQYDGHNDLFQSDPKLGWRFKANYRGSIAYSGEAHHYAHFNEDGFRDVSFKRTRDSHKTILCFGDSFVSNLSVPDDAVFTRIAEHHLEQTSLLNLGVNGYGQTQQLLLMSQVLDSRTADLIVVLIYLRNDFTDNLNADWIYPRPVIRWDPENRPVIDPPPPFNTESPGLLTRLRRSHLLSLFNHTINDFVYRYEAGKDGYRPTHYTPPEFYLCAQSEWEGTDQLFRTMEYLLLQIEQQANQAEIPVLFVLAPSAFQVSETWWRTMLDAYDENPDHYKTTLPNEKLLQFARDNDLNMLDLLPALKQVDSTGESLYHQRDLHWNERGNAVVAETLSNHLRSKGWPDQFGE